MGGVKTKKPRRREGKASTPKYQAAYPGYKGRTLWDVSHPDYKRPVRVLAPVAGSPNGAACIMTAAAYWGRRWQDLGFYAFCEYVRVNGRKKKRQEDT
jgi:hypothetical protein